MCLLFNSLNKNPLGETGCLSTLNYLLAAEASSLLIHPLSKYSQLEHIWYPTNHCAASADLQGAIPRYSLPSTPH